MKLHELYKPLEIKKQTDKAVFVLSGNIDDKTLETVQFIWMAGVKVYLKEDGFWLPKTQIEINGDKVIKITKWLYNKLANDYFNFPTILKEEAEHIANKYKKQI